jgi:hypothetical protein
MSRSWKLTITLFAAALPAAALFGASMSDRERLPGPPLLVTVMRGSWLENQMTPAFVLYRDGTALYRDSAPRTWRETHLDEKEQRLLIKEARRVLIPDLDYPFGAAVDMTVPTIYSNDRRQARISGLISDASHWNGPKCDDFWTFAQGLGALRESLDAVSRPHPLAADGQLPGQQQWERAIKSIREGNWIR